MSDSPVQLRIGDRERRTVDGQLMAAVDDGVLTLAEYDERAAALWQARTRADLDALVADLPSAQRAISPSVPAGRPAPARRVVAVLSEDRLETPVAPGQQVEAYAALGTARVDLRRDDLPEQVYVRAVAVLGEVEVLVPDDATVHLSGMSVLGERKVKVSGGAGPVVHVEAYAVVGTVNVRPGKGAKVARGGSTAVTRSGVSGRLFRRGLVALALVAGVTAGAAGIAASGEDGRVIFGSSIVPVQLLDDEVKVSMLFGSMQVVVPDDVQVRTSGTVVFGSVSCETACRSGGTGRVVEVRSLGGFGSVEVITQSEADRDD
jgi:hypothetical protein